MSAILGFAIGGAYGAILLILTWALSRPIAFITAMKNVVELSLGSIENVM
jgi:hypothetical protein